MILIIGSKAAQILGVPLTPRAKSDFDLIVDAPTLTTLLGDLTKSGFATTKSRECKWSAKKPGVSIEITSDPSDHLFIAANSASVKPYYGLENWTSLTIMLPDVLTLFLIKKSHITFPIHWEKNISDYTALKKMVHLRDGSDKHNAAYELRCLEVVSRHPKKPVHLNETNEDFFNQYQVNRVVDHDALHRITAFNIGDPLFNSMKKDKGMAMCSWSMFSALPHETQIRAVQEEIIIIALERFIIPRRVIVKVALQSATQALATRMWAGDWAQFVVDNYDELLAIPASHDFVQRARGIVSITLLDEDQPPSESGSDSSEETPEEAAPVEEDSSSSEDDYSEDDSSE